MRMKLLLSFGILLLLCGCTAKKKTEQPLIRCNPMNLSYRFRPEINQVSRREAADPAMVNFKGEYYLFASMTGGYWHSTNMADWDLIETDQIPVEDYAPAAVVIDSAIYFMASNTTGNGCPIYKSTDPKSGKWEVACADFPFQVTDPDLFLDDDHRLYFYWGCSDQNPLYGVELNAETFMPIGDPVTLISQNKQELGWEVPGDYNNNTEALPWLEGAWMTKYNGKYYLQYACPGTEFKSYNDAVYVSDSPLSGFQLAKHNPMSYKPEGFIAGIGHGSVMVDNYGNYWHVGTMSISVKHMFERRLGLDLVLFDKDGIMHSNTYFGDYPYIVPQKKIESFDEMKLGWMLLSYGKEVQTSFTLEGTNAQNAVDENIRTYWSATGDKGEWLSVDLENVSQINAVQLNFAENQTSIYGRSEQCFYQYKLEYSNDGELWKILSDCSDSKLDTPHDFIVLETPINARYLRVTNIHIPDGTFAISGFRVFGLAEGNAPQKVSNFQVARQDDKRVALLKWDSSESANGYNVCFGTEADKLYHSYMVLNSDSLLLRSLNANQKYYFQIEAFNESGISERSELLSVE